MAEALATTADPLLGKVAEAREAGYSDDEIIQHLGTVDPRVREAIDAGYAAPEIMDFLGSIGKPAEISVELSPIPSPEQHQKDIEVYTKKRKAETDIGVLDAFGRGFMEPRRDDPFGLDPDLYAKYGVSAPIMSAANFALRELPESIGYGLTDAAGQAVYNLGLTQEDPRRSGAAMRDIATTGSLMATALPLGSVAAETELLMPYARNLFPARTAQPVTREQELYDIAQRHGVELLPADVGGARLKGATAGSAQTTLGGPVISEKAALGQQQLGSAVQRVAAREGDVLPTVEIGEVAKSGARAFSTRTSQRGEYLYKRAEQLAGNTQFDAPGGLQVIDREIARLTQKNDPTDPLLRELEKKRSQIMSDPAGLSYEGMKGIISDAKRAHRSDELRNTDAQRVFGDVSEALSNDLRRKLLVEKGPDAAKAWDTANRFWRERVETIDDVLDPILGPNKSGEDAFAAIDAMTRGGKGGVRRLSGVMREMKPADQQNIRATFIDKLGRARAGAQDETGEVFSADTFLTRWNTMTPEARAAMFGSDPTLMKDLTDLAKLAAARKQTSALANKSGTGRAVNLAKTLELGAAALAGTAGGLKAVVGLATLDYLTGKALASPRLVRMLARPQNLSSPAARDRFIGQLTEVAVRDPAVADVVEQIKQSVIGPDVEQPEVPTTPEATSASGAPELTPEELGQVPEESGVPGVAIGEPEVNTSTAGVTFPDTGIPEVNAVLPRVLHQESRGDPNAISPAGAQGLMQLMPGTKVDPGLGVEPMRDNSPQENVRVGSKYLAALYKRYGGDLATALMAYNWGMNNVDNWLSSGRRGSVPNETRDYVAAILGGQ